MADYVKLLGEQARAMRVSPVPVEEEDDGYASTDGKKIFVNPHFMARIESSAGEGGLRFILAHELGHIHQGMAGGHGAELDADQFAARSVAAMSYGADVIANVMGQLNLSATESHPGAGTREKKAMEAYRGSVSGLDEDKKELKKPIPRFPRHR